VDMAKAGFKIGVVRAILAGLPDCTLSTK
jgi:hypothetical protein